MSIALNLILNSSFSFPAFLEMFTNCMDHLEYQQARIATFNSKHLHALLRSFDTQDLI
jgi:hypothetical protein